MKAKGSSRKKPKRDVGVWVERGLLKKADRLAEKLHVSRSELIADGLRRLLKSA